MSKEAEATTGGGQGDSPHGVRYGHLFADHDNDREVMKGLQGAVLAS